MANAMKWGRGGRVLLALAMACYVPPRLSAQTVGPLDRLLGPGDWVQVTIPGTLIESAVVHRVTADSLHVGQGGQEWLLSGNRIEALAVRERRTKGYAVGGVIGGALFGMVAELFLSPVLCRSGGCTESFATGALVGGVAFGLGLGLVGYHEFRWKPLIP